MARPLRLEYAGALWYVIGRATPRREVFRDEADRAEFLNYLGKVEMMLRWRIVGYVLLKNQFQIIIETPEPNLARGMRQLNGVFTQYYNRRYNKKGPLLQGRYKSILVERKTHLSDLVRFVLWSPVREGLARTINDWRWSSYKATAGLARNPEWLSSEVVLNSFGRQGKRAQEKFKQFMADGRNAGYDPSKHVRGQMFLGSDQFRAEATRLAKGKAGVGRATPRTTGVIRPKMRDIVRAVAEVFGRTEKDVRQKRRGPARKAVSFIARRDGALRLPEIGEALGIREFSASHLATEGEKLYLTDAKFRRDIDKARAKLG